MFRFNIMAPTWGPGNRGKEEVEGYWCSKARNNVNDIARSTSTIPRRPFRAFWAVAKGTPKEEMLELVVSATVDFFLNIRTHVRMYASYSLRQEEFRI